MKNVKIPPVNLGASLENTKISRREIVSLKARIATQRTRPEICADWLASSFGTITFFILNVIWFLAWVIFNSGIFKNVTPFDPFPFNLLTTTVSLEAIFLSIIVLISQNRAAKVDQLRQEVDLQLDLIAEQEITKIMEMLKKLLTHDHVNVSKDAVLEEMLKPTDMQGIENELEKQM